jgi:CBS domain-containing protein
MDRASSMARLPVRTRQVLIGGGRHRTEFTVYCPFRQRSMELEQCEECADFVGSRGDVEETWKEVACQRLIPTGPTPDTSEILARAALQRTAVSRLMERHVICVDPDLPLAEVSGILASNGIGGTPVVDEQFHPLGMVTRTDLLVKGSRFGSAFDAMTRPAICIGERDSLLDAAKLLGEREVHRLVVTGRDDRVVGVLAASDVMRWLSRELPSGEGVAGLVETG